MSLNWIQYHWRTQCYALIELTLCMRCLLYNTVTSFGFVIDRICLWVTQQMNTRHFYLSDESHHHLVHQRLLPTYTQPGYTLLCASEWCEETLLCWLGSSFVVEVFLIGLALKGYLLSTDVILLCSDETFKIHSRHHLRGWFSHCSS